MKDFLWEEYGIMERIENLTYVRGVEK